MKVLQIWGGATSRTLRPHWMAHELGLDYQPCLIGSRTGETQSGEFRSLNPKEKIPVMVDGDLVLTESVAIVTYLGDQYGSDSGLVPGYRSVQRARYNEWMSFVQMELDAHTLYVIRKHRDLKDLYGDAPAAIDTAIAGFNKQVQVAADWLKTQPYLLGEAFSAADLVMMTCLDWANAYGFNLTGPLQPLQSYRARIAEREAYQQATKLNFSISAGA
jgi:glutathione S-transferase